PVRAAAGRRGPRRAAACFETGAPARSPEAPPASPSGHIVRAPPPRLNHSGFAADVVLVTAPALEAAAAEVVVARQPILGRNEEIAGYELLFTASAGRPTAAHAHDATARVLVQSVADVGLEQVSGGHPAHVKLTREVLVAVRPLPLPPGRVVIGLDGNHGADIALLDVLSELRETGFTVALDGFRTGTAWQALSEHAKAVKIGIPAPPRSPLFYAAKRPRAAHRDP